MAPVTPGSHAAWQAEAHRLFHRIPALLARHGVARAPDVRLVDDPAAAYSYYDLQRRAICASLPDVTTPAGRLFWLFLTVVAGLPSEAEALFFGRWLLVYVLGHETGHHLRDRYGAYTADRWLEEHVANEIGLALAFLLPGFRRHAPAMTTLVVRAAERLGGFGGAHVAWAHRDVGEVLVATGVVTEDAWRRAQHLGRETGLRPELILEAAGLEHDAVSAAEREQAEVAGHLRSAYLSDLMEYGAFHLTWLADLLRQPDPPDLGASLAAHLLTPAWEDRRRHAVRLFLRRTVTADNAAAAGAAVVLAREEGAAATVGLATVFPERKPAVQAAILQALAPLPAVPELMAACRWIIERGPVGGPVVGPRDDLQAAASLYLLRHQPEVLRALVPSAAGAPWRALAALVTNAERAALGDGFPAALAASPHATLQALRDCLAIVPECLDGLPLAAWIQPLLRHEATAVRIAALRLLAEPPVVWPMGGPARDVARLAGSRHAEERRAALAALDRLGADERCTLLGPVLSAAAEAACDWGGLTTAAGYYGCHPRLVDLLRHRREAERAVGLDVGAALLDGEARVAAQVAIDEGDGGHGVVRELLDSGLTEDARRAVESLLVGTGSAPPSREALLDGLLSRGDALIRAAVAREHGESRVETAETADPAMVQRALYLRTLDVFRDLGNEVILDLAACSREWGGEAGEAVAPPGEGRALHILLEGRAELCAGPCRAGAGWPLRAGSVFGEECLWSGEPTDWALRCTARCRFVSLKSRAVTSACTEEPALLLRLGIAAAHRLRALAHLPRTAHRQRLHGHHVHHPQHPAARAPLTRPEKLAHLVGVPLLYGCRPESLQALLSAFQTVDLGDGEAAAHAGERLRRLWVIARGYVVLSLPGRPITERLGPGDSFGEVALVDGHGQPWDARAHGNCRLLTVDGETFLAAARRDGTLLTGLLRTLHRRWRDAWEAADVSPTPRQAP